MLDDESVRLAGRDKCTSKGKFKKRLTVLEIEIKLRDRLFQKRWKKRLWELRREKVLGIYTKNVQRI